MKPRTARGFAIVVLLGLIQFSCTVSSQERVELSLEDTVRAALSDNPRLQLLERQFSLTQAQLRAKSAPTVSVDASLKPFTGSESGTGTKLGVVLRAELGATGGTGTLGVSGGGGTAPTLKLSYVQPLGMNSSAVSLAPRLEELRAWLSYWNARRDLVSKVLGAYRSLVEATHGIEASSARWEFGKKRLEWMTSRLESGHATRLEVAYQKRAVRKLESELQAERENIDRASSLLLTLLGRRNPSESIIFAPKRPFPTLRELFERFGWGARSLDGLGVLSAELLKRAEKSRPDLQLARAELEAKELVVSRAEMPAGLKAEFYGNLDWPYENAGPPHWEVGLNLSSGFRTPRERFSSEKARLDLAESGLVLREMVLTARGEIESLVSAIERSRMRIVEIEEDLALARNEHEVLESASREGLRRPFDLMESELRMLELRHELAEQELFAATKALELREALGMDDPDGTGY